MGIGLSLCRSIIESHRGRIKAQNLYNGTTVSGCRFAFTLPVETTARHDESPLASSLLGPAGAAPDAGHSPAAHPLS